MTITTTTLKNAARAIEHDLFTDPDGCNYLVKDGAILRRWEPEHSSADSFELAISLGLTIGNGYESAYVDLCCGEILSRMPRGGCQHDVPWSEFGGDKFAACRKAVILCAAQIGAAL